MIFRYWFKSKYRLNISFNLITIWSNFVHIFEKRFMTNLFFDTYNDESHDLTSSNFRKSPISSWGTFCEEKELSHYGSDKWYMGGELYSNPYRSVARKKMDCDDFALVSYEYFGNYINYDGDVYEFLGIYTLMYNDGNGHAIAIWKSESSNVPFLMVTNNEMIKINDFLDYWKNNSGGIRFVGKFDYDGSIKYNGICDIIDIKNTFYNKRGTK